MINKTRFFIIEDCEQSLQVFSTFLGIKTPICWKVVLIYLQSSVSGVIIYFFDIFPYYVVEIKSITEQGVFSICRVSLYNITPCPRE